MLVSMRESVLTLEFKSMLEDCKCFWQTFFFHLQIACVITNQPILFDLTSNLRNACERVLKLSLNSKNSVKTLKENSIVFWKIESVRGVPAW